MRPLLTLLMLTGILSAQTPDLRSTADQDFIRIETARDPKPADAIACAQSQAAYGRTLPPGERYRARFRQGFCQLYAAQLSRDRGAFDAAANDFQQAAAGWPAGLGAPPAGLLALTPMVRLAGGGSAAAELTAALAGAPCSTSPLMTGEFCSALTASARSWLAWLAWRSRNLDEVRRHAPADSAWAEWLNGYAALERGQAAQAAALLSSAMKEWTGMRKSPAGRFGPPVDGGAMHAILGQALHAAGQHPAAIESLTLALAENPGQSMALYQRARSQEALGDFDAAIAGYAAAIEAARASNDTTWPIGEASVRKALLDVRAGRTAIASQEFDRALGAPLGEFPRGDVEAWREWTAASDGQCETARLARALTRVSPKFPKRDAELLVVHCQISRASTLEQLLSVEAAYGQAAAEADRAALRKRIGAAYAERGVAADDRRDTDGAREAYVKAVEYDPTHAKARFNLGAIYFEEKRFDLAEAEYRALAGVAPADHEAQFWVGASMLAQKPDESRRVEACGWLKRALETGDVEQKAEFTRTYAATGCQ